MVSSISRFVLACACACVCACGGVDPSPAGPRTDPPDFVAGGRVGDHGMVAFGNARTGLYLSHIPMDMRPHDVQVVFAATFDGVDRDLDGELFTFVPDARLALDDLILTTPSSVRGTLFRGNFERGGVALGPVVAHVGPPISALTHALVDHHPTAAASRSRTYVVFGGHGATYVAHRISERAPDFDQIAPCSIADRSFRDDELARGVALELAEGPRLAPGPRDAVTPSGRHVTITVGTILSTLSGPRFKEP